MERGKSSDQEYPMSTCVPLDLAERVRPRGIDDARRKFDLLANALRAIVHSNDTIGGAVGSVRDPEAAELARRVLNGEGADDLL
jgi:hypothetical protein